MDQLVSKLKDLIPLDDESLRQAIEYGLGLSEAEMVDHFMGLVGESELLFKFLEQVTKSKQSLAQNKLKVKPQSQSQPQPSPFGSKAQNSDHKPNLSLSPDSVSGSSGGTAGRHTAGTETSRQASGGQTQKEDKDKKRGKITDISEIEELMRKLEYDNTNDETVCDCNGTEHEVNHVIPNCLNCGKIICLKEANRVSCSFCKEPLIPNEEKLEMLRLLRHEKQQIEDHKQKLQEQQKLKQQQSSSSKKNKKKNSFKISMGGAGGESFSKQQDQLLEKLEKKRKELDKAKDNLSNLLNYQENSAQRTQIIDHAADFALPDETNMWTKSSLNKILEFKKQQRNLKERERKQQELSGRGRKVLSLNISNGTVTVETGDVGELEDEYDEEVDDDIKEIESQINRESREKQKKEFQKHWDFEQDSKKWQQRKVVYKDKHKIPVENEESGNDLDIDEQRIQGQQSMDELILMV